jgi:hypothetical protein
MIDEYMRAVSLRIRPFHKNITNHAGDGLESSCNKVAYYCRLLGA